MNDLKNYAEINFTNAVLIDIFSRYTDNKTLADIVSESGSIKLKFVIDPPMEPPKTCENVLSLIFALFESNPESAIGKIYIEHQKEILREVIYRLSYVLDGFSDVRMTIHTTERDKNDPEKEHTSHTEFTLKRTKTTQTRSNTQPQDHLSE